MLHMLNVAIKVAKEMREPKSHIEVKGEGELIETLKEYIVLLTEELDELAIFADVHGWKSKRIEKGNELREKIKQLEPHPENGGQSNLCFQG